MREVEIQPVHRFSSLKISKSRSCWSRAEELTPGRPESVLTSALGHRREAHPPGAAVAARPRQLTHLHVGLL